VSMNNYAHSAVIATAHTLFNSRLSACSAAW
jgi:hypothetical protein